MKLKYIISTSIFSIISLIVLSNHLQIPTLECPRSLYGLHGVVDTLKAETFQGLNPCGPNLNRSCYHSSLYDPGHNYGQKNLSRVSFEETRYGNLLTCTYGVEDPFYFYVKIFPGDACELRENDRRVMGSCNQENLQECHLHCSAPLVVG